MHPKVLLSSRFVTFLNSLLSSTKLGVRLIARLSERDGRTVMGRTTDTLLRDYNLTDIMLPNSKPVKKKMRNIKGLAVLLSILRSESRNLKIMGSHKKKPKTCWTMFAPLIFPCGSLLAGFFSGISSFPLHPAYHTVVQL